MIRISGSLIWSKTLTELIYSPYGEFRWSPEGPVSQIHTPHLHIGAPGIFSDLLRSVQRLKRERVGCRKQMGSYCTYSIPGRTAALVPEFVMKDRLRQNCSLGSCACSEGTALGQNTLMIMMELIFTLHHWFFKIIQDYFCCGIIRAYWHRNSFVVRS